VQLYPDPGIAQEPSLAPAGGPDLRSGARFDQLRTRGSALPGQRSSAPPKAREDTASLIVAKRGRPSTTSNQGSSLLVQT
jgi:hypothetical protein